MAKGGQEGFYIINVFILIPPLVNDDMSYPRLLEKFTEVNYIDEHTGEILKTLHDADLYQILEGIKEVMEAYK